MKKRPIIHLKTRQQVISYPEKVIVSGKIVEWFEYEKPVIKGFGSRCPGRSNSSITSDEVKKHNREKIASRAKSKVRRTANANPDLNKFLTLTFKENVTDLNFAWREFDKFIKRLKTRFKNFKFINVIEFQERGAVHFHLLCNLPYVDVNELAKIWGNGFIKLNRIDEVDNVGAYITKYMTKDNIDERLIGRKCYSMSRGLKKPKEYTHKEEVKEVLKNLAKSLKKVKRSYTSTFETEHYGKITYTQYVLSEEITLPRKRHRFMDFVKARLCPLPDDTPTPF